MVAFDYTQSIQATGGVAPFAWTVSSGSLPYNLDLGTGSTNTANISGIPDTPQTATFTVQVKDAKNQIAVQAYTLNINSTGLAQLLPVVGQVPAGTIEIRGVSAGPFNPPSWQQDTLNWVPDMRMPTFAAQTTGQYQNIYPPGLLNSQMGGVCFTEDRTEPILPLIRYIAPGQPISSVSGLAITLFPRRRRPSYEKGLPCFPRRAEAHERGAISCQ